MGKRLEDRSLEELWQLFFIIICMHLRLVEAQKE